MNTTSNPQTPSFHGILDSELSFISGRYIGSREAKTVIVQERDVSYRFYTHFHPYVKQLAQKLLRKGISGLQACDTEFKTRICLANASSATNQDGRKITLSSSDLVLVPDGATAVLDGITVRFIGSKILRVHDDSLVIPTENTQVTIPHSTKIRLSSGDLATLDSDVTGALRDGAPQPLLYADIFTASQYDPSALVQQPYPIKDLDFESVGGYSVYNWELFFHVPLTIAIHLSKNQRFAEAQHWFHFLFDPTDDSDGPTPDRFWKVKPFQTTDVKQIEDIIVNLATGVDEELRNNTLRSIDAWKDAPFRPHVIARVRQQAYMYKTVMAYLDNLIAWGDSLYRQDTGEAIDEAMIVYMLAANILGPRPQAVPKKGGVRPQTYANLRNDLQQFGTVMRDVEPEIPFDLLPYPGEPSEENDRLSTLRSLGKALYLGVPRNDKLLGYWDTVSDRLFKIRNSLNIQGIFRQLALFEPPIDPAMLARAAAAGLDVASIVSGLHQPLPLVRFQVLLQKATEIIQEVKSLGNSLLLAMEKEDGEALSVLRSKHERVVLEMVEHVKYAQLQESIKSKEGLLKSLALALHRYSYYERQLGKKDDEIVKAIPDLGELDTESLEKMKFAMNEPEVPLRIIEIDISQELGDFGGEILSSHERNENQLLAEARDLNEVASVKERIGAGLSLLPELGVSFQFWGMGGTMSFGGSALSRTMSFWSGFARADAEKKTYESGGAARVGTYSRREQDWTFQSNLAAGEITQVFKQLRAAQLREAIAEQELKSHRKQMEHAAEIERFLNEEGTQKTGKKTNKALYTWMKREVKGLYGQCFQFAFDVAKRAERALQHELGNRELTYLQFGYLSGKEGLLAGERLYLDVKRMEVAYHELNQREYEMTKHVSLLQVAPFALLNLRRTGRCMVTLPESLFDMDGPGHYFRRIKSVAVTIPCVSGPYVSVNCTLSLLKSGIRKTPVLRDGAYAREDAEDDRFEDYFGNLQSIITSSAQSDSGLFEMNLRDERYLPFENAGVISEWQLELPGNPSLSDPDPVQFDYETISDVILHIRYSAREGGALLRQGAISHLKTLINEAKASGTFRLFSARDEFPNAWAKFQGQPPGDNQRFGLELGLREEHYPYWSKGRLKAVNRIDIVASSSKNSTSLDIYDAGGNKCATLQKDTSMGNVFVGQCVSSLPTPVADLKLFFDDKDLDDLWVVVTWGGNE